MAVRGGEKVCRAAVAGVPARMGSLWGLALSLFFCFWEAGAAGSSAGKGTRESRGLLSWQGSGYEFLSWQLFVGEGSYLELIN